MAEVARAGAVGSQAAPADPKRTLGTIAVALVLFASVAGGPYGIEDAVGAAGALPTIIGTVVVAILWSATQALVAAELATTFPSDGGYVTWVMKGLGPTLGFVNTCNTVASAICNLPLYPVLFASYLAHTFPSITGTGLWLIKLAVVLLTLGLNVLGLEAVSTTALVFSCIVQTPFILIPIVAAARGVAFDWSAVASTAPGLGSSLSVFVATLCWNAQGWVNIGNVASAVKNPQTSYPRGATLAVVAVALNYIYPVIVCVALSPNLSSWDTGHFTEVAAVAAPWLQYWAACAAAFSCLNNFQPQMATTARALRFAALYRIAPIPGLTQRSRRFNTPVAALVLQAIIVIILMSYDYTVLVVVNVLFYNFGLMLQFASFLRLRLTATGRSLERPFKIAGGTSMAVITVVGFYSILGISFYAAYMDSWAHLVAVCVANVIFVAVGAMWSAWYYVPGVLEAVDAAESRQECALEAAAAVIRAYGGPPLAVRNKHPQSRQNLHGEQDEAASAVLLAAGRPASLSDTAHSEIEPVTAAAIIISSATTAASSELQAEQAQPRHFTEKAAAAPSSESTARVTPLSGSHSASDLDPRIIVSGSAYTTTMRAKSSNESAPAAAAVEGDLPALQRSTSFHVMQRLLPLISRIPGAPSISRVASRQYLSVAEQAQDHEDQCPPVGKRQGRRAAAEEERLNLLASPQEQRRAQLSPLQDRSKSTIDTRPFDADADVTHAAYDKVDHRSADVRTSSSTPQNREHSHSDEFSGFARAESGRRASSVSVRRESVVAEMVPADNLVARMDVAVELEMEEHLTDDAELDADHFCDIHTQD